MHSTKPPETRAHTATNKHSKVQTPDTTSIPHLEVGQILVHLHGGALTGGRRRPRTIARGRRRVAGRLDRF
jgi:hypothetical protein